MKVTPADIKSATTYSYHEVFPNGDQRAFACEYEDQFFYVLDRYCMNPSCKCMEVVLVFIDEKKDTQFVVSLKLKNRKFDVRDKGIYSNSDISKIMTTFLQGSDEVIELLMNRYAEMKEEGERILLKERKTKISNQNLAVTVGRNDPCHCGSGKKYKKCCG